MKFEYLQIIGEIDTEMEKEVFNFLTKLPEDVDTIFYLLILVVVLLHLQLQ